MVIYALVHEHCVWNEYENLVRKGRSLGRIPAILQELERIRAQESWFEIKDPSKVLYAPKEQVLVCGAYAEMCVERQVRALRSWGVSCQIYEAGTLFAVRDLRLNLPSIYLEF